MNPFSLALPAVAAISLAISADSLPSAVYHAPTAAQSSQKATSQQLLKGSTLDLKTLEITTNTLPPGQTTRSQSNGAETLLIVESGQLAVGIHDSTKTLAAGGVLLAMAGDQPTLRNSAATTARYWVLKFSATEGANAARGQMAGGAFARDWASFTVTKTDKGETRPVFNRPSSMFPRFDVHATVLNAGKASHPPHTHRTEEIILMTQGSGQILIDKTSYPAAVGDAVLLRTNVPHAFTNTSQAPVGYFAIQWHSQAELSASPAK
jgi:quercetin dioxygenase-like cupin family protein